MAAKVLYSALIAAEFLFVPWFLKAQWPNKTRKSLILKMICATIFVSLGLLAAGISGHWGSYTEVMIIGLVMSWLGDFLLHVSPKVALFIMGGAAFLTAHVFYITAYITAQKAVLPGAASFDSREITAALILAAVIMSTLLLMKINFGMIAIPGALYLVMVSMMFVKATSLGVRMLLSGVPNGGILCALLSLGGLFFVLSDTTLAMIMFDTRFKKFKLKVFNIVTYFAAQVMLASTVLFIS